MTDPARAMKVLTELRGLGVQLALDDFGTGWSSLTHLRRMPIHEIKIDRSFVAAMATEANSAAIVSCTVDLAHALGLRVVAEGIEDEAAWRRLRAVGCDAAQGYHPLDPFPPPNLRPQRTRAPSARTPRQASRCQPPDPLRPPFIVILAPFISNGRPSTSGEALLWPSIGVRTGQTRREAGTQSQRSLADGSATGSPGARTTDGV